MKDPDFEREHPRNRRTGEWRDKLGLKKPRQRGRETLLRIERNAAARQGRANRIVQIDVVRALNERVQASRDLALKHGVKADTWDKGLESGLLAAKAIIRRGGGLEEIRAAARAHGPKVGGGDLNDGFQTGMRFAAIEIEDATGARLTRLVKASPLVDPAGRIDGYLAVLRELRKMSVQTSGSVL